MKGNMEKSRGSREALVGLRNGGGGGWHHAWRGLRPQHLKDMINLSANGGRQALLSSLTLFIKLVLEGDVPVSARPYFFGANEAARQPAHGRAVCFITFLAKLVRKALEETCCCWTSSTRRCPDQRAECGVLYFTNPSFVFCALLAFMAAVEAWEAGECVRLHVRIKRLYVKECV